MACVTPEKKYWSHDWENSGLIYKPFLKRGPFDPRSDAERQHLVGMGKICVRCGVTGIDYYD